MTSEQAISLLSQLAAQYKGTLEEHNALQEALQVLTLAVQKAEKTK
jgi:hypothetical protein